MRTLIAIAIMAAAAMYLEVACNRATQPPTVQINIIVDTPRQDQLIILRADGTGHVLISGRARGFWYFEASFPVALYDANGKELVRTYIMTDKDWMTTDFVPFEKDLDFPKPTTKHGILRLEKDNPSGLPEHDEHIDIAVRFE
jgi:hypothetical protein